MLNRSRRQFPSSALAGPRAKTLSTLRLQALEPRVLLDAAAAATAATMAEQAQPHAVAEPNAADAQLMQALEKAQAAPVDAGRPADRAAAATGANVFFIDRSLPDVQTLVADLPAGAEVHFIEPGTDGVHAMAQALQGRSDIASIQIVSHGSEGELHLGSATLTAASMQGQYHDDLVTIGHALSATGDIRIYGCDFGAGADGLAAAQLLSDLTGADVASSTDDTGAAALGADWVLEREVGTVEAQTFVAADWQHELGDNPPTPQITNSTFDTTAGWTNSTGFIQNVGWNPVGGYLMMDVNNKPASTLTWNTPINGWNDGPGANGAATVAFDFAWNNGWGTNPATNLAGNKFDVMVGGVLYARIETAIGGAVNSPGDATVTYFNGASGNVASIAAGIYKSWTFTNVVVSLPKGIADGSKLSIVGSTQASSDDMAVDNIQVYTSLPQNRPPVAADDTGTVAEDESLVVPMESGLLSNDKDPDGNTLTITSYTVPGIADPIAAGNPAEIPGVGTLTIHADGSYSFTPLKNYHGDVPVATYTVTDGEASTTATLSLTVTPVNHPPVAVGELYFTEEDKPLAINLLANDTDPDGDALTIQSINGMTLTPGTAQSIDVPNGKVDVAADGSMIFTPAPNFSGTYTSFDYVVADPSGATATATARVGVKPVNDPPVAVDDNFTTPQGTAVPLDLIGNDTDVDRGDKLRLASINGTPITPGTAQAIPVPNGTVNVAADGTLSFMPTPGFSGPVTFDYVVSDDVNATDTGTVHIDVTATNHPPVAVDDSFVVDEDKSVALDLVGNDTDVDGGALHVASINGVELMPGTAQSIDVPNGKVTVAADGTLTFVPNPNYNGKVEFDYVVADAADARDTGHVTITVNPVADRVNVGGLKDGVVAGTDAQVSESGLPGGTDAGGPESTTGGTFTIGPVENLVDFTLGKGTLFTRAQLEAATPDAPLVSNGNYGQLRVTGYDAATGTVSYTYTLTKPADQSQYVINDSFRIDVTNIDRIQYEKTSYLLINIVDDAPKASDDVDSVDIHDAMVSGNVTSNDKLGADGKAANGPVTGVAAGAGAPVGGVGTPVAGSYGSLVLNADGTYSYTVDSLNPSVAALQAGQTLTETFTYQITDGDGDNATATLTIVLQNNQVIQPVPPEVFITGLDDGPRTGTDAQVREAGLATGTDPDATSEVASGSFNMSPGWNVGSISLNGGDPITINQLMAATPAAPITIVGDYGTLSITGFDPNSGTVDYVYTLTKPADQHAGPASDEFVIDITNSAGTTTHNAGVLAVDILDDSPVAKPDTADVNENAAPVTGNVIGNDTFGADGKALSGPVTGVAAGLATAPEGNVGSGVPGTYGTLKLNADGSYSYAVDNANPKVDALKPGQTLTEVFSYSVKDGDGDAAQATLTITIHGANDAPVAVDDTAVTQEGKPVALDLIGNDTDVDDVTLHIVSINGEPLTPGTAQAIPVPNGTVNVAADGTISFMPAPGYNGPVTFDYVVADPSGAEDTGTVNITVTPVNDPPVAVDDTATTPEGKSVTLNLIGNDTDVDDVTLHIVSINGEPRTPGTAQSIPVPNGTVNVAADGTISFMPAPGYNGPVTFDYVVADPSGATDTGTVNITVTPVNDPPVAVDDTATTPEGKSVTLNLIGNDTDVDDVTLHIVSINGEPLTPGTAQAIPVPNGTVNVAADGTITFMPAPGYNGPVTFDYVVADPSGAEDTGTVNITVTPVNDPPVAVDDSFTTPEEESVVLNLIGNDTDVDDVTLHIVSINGEPLTPGTAQSIPVPNGTVNVAADGTISFMPAPDYNGPVAFDYVVADPSGATDTGTVNITVTPVNDPPVAVDDSFTTPEDESVVLNLIGNDTDVDDVALHIVSINGETLTPGTAQSIPVPNGTVNVAADGTITFMPAPDYNGPVKFDYVVADPSGAEDTGTVNITVTPVNDPPVISVPTKPAGPGTPGYPVTPGEPGQPDVPGEPGHPVTPGAPGTPSDPAKTAVSTPEDTTLVVSPKDGLLSNVTDVDGDPLVIKDYTVPGLPGPIKAGEPATIPGIGTVTIDPDGGYKFTPVVDYHGPVPEITYTVDDGHGGTAEGKLDIVVTPVNDAPVAIDDSVTTPEDKPVTLNLIGNDTDMDGDTLHIVSINGETLTPGTAQSIPVPNGTVNVAADGTISFMPAPDYNGPVKFDYVVADPSGAEDTGTVNITVTPVNDPPVISVPTKPAGPGTPGYPVTPGEPGQSDVPGEPGHPVIPGAPGTPSDPAKTAVSTPEDTTLVVSPKDGLLSNVTDVDGDPLVIKDYTVPGLPGPIKAGEPATIPGIGTVTIDPDGGYKFTPVVDYHGPVPEITYTVDDGHGGTAEGKLDIVVTPVNDAPVAVDDQFTTPEDEAVVLNLIGNDTDVDGDTLHIVSINGETLTPGTAQSIPVPNGTVNVAADGTISFMPAPDYNGPVKFDYVVADPSGATDTGTVNITVTPVNDAPVISVPTKPAGPGTPGHPVDPGNPAKPGQPGEAVETAISTPEDTPLVVSPKDGLLSNVTDIDGDPLVIKDYTVPGVPGPIKAGEPATIPGVGTVTIDPDGGYKFTPVVDYHGPVPEITYTVDDGHGGTVEGKLDIVVTPVNDAPVAIDDNVTTPEDKPVTLNLLGNDTDVDGDTLHIVSINGVDLTPGTAQSIPVPNGTVNVAADGTITFMPAPDYNGPVSFDYEIADPSGARDTGTVNITVTPVNDPPVVQDETVQVIDGHPVHAGPKDGLLPNDRDPEGDPLTVKDITVDGLPGPIKTGTPVQIPGKGVLLVNEDGSYSFTPERGYTGDVKVHYTVSDGHGGLTPGLLTLQVKGDLYRGDYPFVFEPSDSLFEHRGTDKRITAEGAVLDAVNGIDSLNGTQMLDANGAVLQAVNGVQTLHGSSLESSGRSLGTDTGSNVVSRVAADNRLREQFGRFENALPEEEGEGEQAQGLGTCKLAPSRPPVAEDVPRANDKPNKPTVQKDMKARIVVKAQVHHDATKGKGTKPLAKRPVSFAKQLAKASRSPSADQQGLMKALGGGC
ncbi:Ig-like domain-containing protein [Variovorax robiniae]|uniref:Ig-like domain-containing protein n=1 Tax=Variovorax robiniae TaxID=1836199 RepID=A0ABU8XAD6_9BURK